MQGREQHLRLWMVENVARARGLAQAIAECHDDAPLDRIREGAAEIATLLELPDWAFSVLTPGEDNIESGLQDPDWRTH